MLRQIERLQDVGFFQDFRWPVDASFESISVIYGPNGSGKSTISRELLAALDADDVSPHPLRLLVGNRDEAGRRADSRDELFSRLYVFSEVFVRENHRLSDTEATVPAIVTLGKRSIENQSRLAELRASAEHLRREVTTRQEALELARKDLTTHLQSVSAAVVDALSTYGAPFQSRSHFNKNHVARQYESHGLDREVLEHSQYIEALRIATGPAPEMISLPAASFGITDPSWASETSGVLAESPVTLVLNTLRSSPLAENWVREGRGLHTHSATCIFCGGIFPPGRREEIDSHFSEGVNRVRARAQQLAAVLENRIDEGRLLPRAIESAFTPLTGSRRPDFERAFSVLRSEVEFFIHWAQTLRSRLLAKADNVAGLIDRDGVETPPAVDLEPFRQLAAAHNKDVSQHHQRRTLAASAVRDHHLKQGEPRYLEALARVAATEDDLHAVNVELKSAESSIAAVEETSSDITPSATFLTQEVGRILGRQELSFHALGQERYEVRRYGAPAHALSEGERTAITLVHFLESVRRHDRTTLGLPVVLVDDPVSSLDQGVFIGVSSALWSIAARQDPIIEQLILLTHNFELFRQWDIQWERFPKTLKSRQQGPGLGFSSFELTSRVIQGRRTPRLTRWPRSEEHRRKSRSAYHHAFMTLAGAAARLRDEDELDARLEAQLLFPNVIRRVLETFLAFKFPGSVGDLAKMMAAASPILEKSSYQGDAGSLRHDLLRFSNIYSHGETPQTDHLIGPEEVHAAIGALFTFMHHVDEAHFAGMCEATGFQAADLMLPREKRD